MNVKSIEKLPATDALWPKKPWHQVAPALVLNVPQKRGKQTYHFCIKQDLNQKEHKDACQMTIVLQSTGHVQFMATQSVKETERIADYCGLHRAHLRDIANTLENSTVLILVGKLTKHFGRETFLVYYLIENTRVILDSVTCRKMLHPGGSDFEDFLLCLGPYIVVEAEVDPALGTITCEELDRAPSGQQLLGFPIVQLESRGVNETPIMLSTPMHMRFMAFTFAGT